MDRRHTLGLRVSRYWMRTLLVALALATASLVAPVPGRAQDPAVWTFQGRVYEGKVGDESRPLPGVTVELYAANNFYPEPGELIDRTVTDGKGWYGLQVRQSQTAYEVYSIREVDPQGYESAGATSVDGKIRTSNWIEYVVHLDNKTLNGNNFWDRSTAGPQPHEGADLAIRFDEWHSEEEFRFIVLVVEVSNEGDAETRASEVLVGEPDWGWMGVIAEVGALGPGGVTAVKFVVEIPLEQRGATHSFRIEVDPKGLIAELDEENNTVWTPGIAIPPLEEPPGPGRQPSEGPDLAVRCEDWRFEEDDRFLVLSVQVFNQGNAESPATLVYTGAPDRGWEGDLVKVDGLGPRGMTTVEVWLKIPEEQRGTTMVFTVEVDPHGQIGELNEENNVASTSRIPVPKREEQTPPPLTFIIAGVAIVALGGIALAARRAIRRSREVRQPVVPAFPPVRLARIWLTEGQSGAGRVLTDNEPLIAGTPYNLHLQIQSRGAQDEMDDELPKELVDGESAQLEVVFFSPETDFALEREAVTLQLPSQGSSEGIHRPITPQRAGGRRLRACIYYKNVLLQSVLLEAIVALRGANVAAKDRRRSAAAISRTVDYVANSDFANLEDLPRPALNIFTNQASDGSHWIGLFASGEASGFRLRNGDMHTFGPGELAAMARQMRELLAEIEGKRQYKLAAPVPLEARQLERREKGLVALAITGYTLYDALFLSREDGLDMDRLRALRDALRDPGIISVARCCGERTTIPWAALYDLPLDTGKPDEIRLCETLKSQLAANTWNGDVTELVEKHDRLDDPLACRANPRCPLKGADRKLTVCPFGFWGFMHQIEQPLQQVKAKSVDEVPEELRSRKFNQTSFLMCPRDSTLHIAMGAYPGIPDADDHHVEIRALMPADVLAVSYEEDRDRVVRLLERGGYHLYYLYCHGEMEGQVFKLKLGPRRRPGYISAADLNPFEIDWPDEPRPLVILNGCETMALTPELTHRFLGKLKSLGASGVVGSEIKVWTQLARPFGRLLIKRIFEGRSVGEAFLDGRVHLLRQYNPLGLVFSYYSPATLHLHEPDACAWCRAHPPTRIPPSGD